jgi:hypothetical protein
MKTFVERESRKDKTVGAFHGFRDHYSFLQTFAKTNMYKWMCQEKYYLTTAAAVGISYFSCVFSMA